MIVSFDTTSVIYNQNYYKLIPPIEKLQVLVFTKKLKSSDDEISRGVIDFSKIQFEQNIPVLTHVNLFPFGCLDLNIRCKKI